MKNTRRLLPRERWSIRFGKIVIAKEIPSCRQWFMVGLRSQDSTKKEEAEWKRHGGQPRPKETRTVRRRRRRRRDDATVPEKKTELDRVYRRLKRQILRRAGVCAMLFFTGAPTRVSPPSFRPVHLFVLTCITVLLTEGPSSRLLERYAALRL